MMRSYLYLYFLLYILISLSICSFCIQFHVSWRLYTWSFQHFHLVNNQIANATFPSLLPVLTLMVRSVQLKTSNLYWRKQGQKKYWSTLFYFSNLIDTPKAKKESCNKSLMSLSGIWCLFVIYWREIFFSSICLWIIWFWIDICFVRT